MNTSGGLFKRGSTYNWGTTDTLTATYGNSVGIEGHIGYFTDETVSTGGIKTKRSDRIQKCIVVRNVSPAAGGHDGAGALLPGRLCSWASGYIGRRVDGGTTTNYARVAGVVDERLPSAGVPRFDLFWLQVAGPCLCRNAISEVADITAGDFLVALTGATSGCTTSGRIQKMVVASTDARTVHEQWIGKFGRAISGCTSSGTCNNVLVDLDCMNI